MHIKFLFLLLLFLSLNIKAQQLNNSFPFKDGIYRQFDGFKKNNAVQNEILNKLSFELNPDENVLMFKAESQKKLDSLTVGQYWGVCINQIPYFKTSDLLEGRPYFVRLHLIGKISYFYYKAFREKELTMYVHNPYTGEKIGQKNITNRDLVFVQRMLNFQSGETIDFTFENVLKWTKEDTGLAKSLKEMKTNEKEEKLFKTLLIYNDRNPVVIEK